MMNEKVYHYLQSNPGLLNFVRHNPIWYRYLSRDPERIYELEKEAKVFYGKTFSQKIEKVSEQVQMVYMLAQLIQHSKN